MTLPNKNIVRIAEILLLPAQYGFQKLNECGVESALKAAGHLSTAVCSVAYFAVQSRQNYIRMPPGEGEMQITCAASVRRLS